MTETAIDNRRTILQQAINNYLSQGFRVVSQTDTTAQLVKPKKFSFWMCILLFGVFYIPYYLAKKDKVIYLQVDVNGALSER